MLDSRLTIGCFAVFYCILFTPLAFKIGLHQIGQWTWIKGSKSIKSIANDSHKQYPGARYGTTAWTDDTGRVWMYGGMVEDLKTLKRLDELWMFDVKKIWHYIGAKSGKKTWPMPCVHCASCSHGNQAVIFGGRSEGFNHFHTWVFNMASKEWSVIKIESPSPREGSTYWCNKDKGLLFLYGGIYKNKGFQDMWQFSFSTMEWSEIHIPQNSSFPRERYLAVSWAKHDDDLYLFGGSSFLGIMSDVWVFSTTLKQWKLVNGNSDKFGQSGIYSHRGIPSNHSVPGCRSEAASWNDSQGNLWMFGGVGCDNLTCNNITMGLLSDLWVFNTSSFDWTWMGGPSKINEEAVYGKQGKPSPRNIPSPRKSSLSFSQGNDLWIFGGFGINKSHCEGPLEDMWVYSVVPSISDGLSGDTLDMPYTQRLVIAFGILTIAMIFSLLVCYRKECNIMFWRYKKKSPNVKYQLLRVKMQVPKV